MRNYLSIKLCYLIMFFLFRSLKVLGLKDERARAYFASLPENLVIRINFNLKGEGLCIVKQGGKLSLSGSQDADIVITFKSSKISLRVFTGLKGIGEAYSEHRFTLSGSIEDTLVIVRMIELAEGYLFPRFMTRRILRHVPEKEFGSLTLYRKVLLGV